MEVNSFYGGRQGFSIVIAAHFNSIKEMVAAFKQGGDYTEVKYGEYALIDTENKNNADNGKLYQRSYEYSNNMGGAVYKGQLIGPSGMAPHLALDTYDNVINIPTQTGFEYKRDNGTFSLDNGTLVPGKSEEGDVYNDEILWSICSVRDENAVETIANIGFKIPYTVMDFNSQSISPYRNGVYADTTAIIRIDDETHPFYQKWRISIPKGVKGDSCNNFRVMVADNSIENYPTKADDISNGRKVLVCDYYTYDSQENGNKKIMYIGPFDQIENIEVSNSGVVTITTGYSGAREVQLKYPANASINTGTTEGTGNQKVKITYTDGTSQDIGQPLNYIIATAIDTRYHLLVYYADPAKRSALSDKATYDGKNDWADLGYIGNGTGVGAIAGRESDTGISSIANSLPPYSAWFVIEDDE